MNGWERAGKRATKSAIFCIAYGLLCWASNVEPTWTLFWIVLGCCLVNDFLDAFLPTATTVPPKDRSEASS